MRIILDEKMYLVCFCVLTCQPSQLVKIGAVAILFLEQLITRHCARLLTHIS